MLTALTGAAFADKVVVLQPTLPLQQLSSLRRLGLQYTLWWKCSGRAALPDLPIPLTHLTLGVHTQGPCGGKPVYGQSVPELLGQLRCCGTTTSPTVVRF